MLKAHFYIGLDVKNTTKWRYWARGVSTDEAFWKCWAMCWRQSGAFQQKDLKPTREWWKCYGLELLWRLKPSLSAWSVRCPRMNFKGQHKKENAFSAEAVLHEGESKFSADVRFISAKLVRPGVHLYYIYCCLLLDRWRTKLIFSAVLLKYFTFICGQRFKEYQIFNSSSIW